MSNSWVHQAILGTMSHVNHKHNGNLNQIINGIPVASKK